MSRENRAHDPEKCAAVFRKDHAQTNKGVLDDVPRQTHQDSKKHQNSRSPGAGSSSERASCCGRDRRSLGPRARRKDRRVTLDPQRSLREAASHHQIDEAQYRGGRAFQDDWEKAERGPRAVDPTREYVDGGQAREPITERQRRAVLRLNRIERELGADGIMLVHEVLVQGLTMEQIGQRRGLRGQRWMDYFAKRFRECLDRLALIYGFANEKAAGKNQRPSG